MTAVTEMLAPHTSEAAIDLAHRMRMLMGRDLEEDDLARLIEEENVAINRTQSELLQQAWTVLSTPERRAWTAWLEYALQLQRRKMYGL